MQNTVLGIVGQAVAGKTRPIKKKKRLTYKLPDSEDHDLQVSVPGRVPGPQ